MTETAIFAGGCFWCTEAIFKRLTGVISVQSGYSGGKTTNPRYEDVTTGETGHAESIQITFDPMRISYKTLLDVFFATHDPTTLNQQGADIGTQYRSAIFYQTEEQKVHAQAKIKELQDMGKYPDPIVTEVTKAQAFYPAEDYHDDYYTRNRDRNPYCAIVIDPKIKKLLKEFGEEVEEQKS